MKSLSKLMKLVVVMMVSIFTVAFLSGCGSTPDKFAGHWIGYGTADYPLTDCIYDVNIEKNGNGQGYLVNVSKSYWQTLPTSNWAHFKGRLKQYKYKWEEHKEDNITAVSKDNILTMQGPGSPFFTYLEKDNTLQFTFNNQEKMGAQERIVLHPATENEAQEFKDKKKAELQQKIDPNTAEISFTDQ